MPRLLIPAMHCSGCVASITRAIAAVDPAARVDTDLATREADIHTDMALAPIQAKLAEIGFDSRPVD